VWSFQLVRCTVIIVTALLKAFVYGDRLSVHMWLGVAINLFAMMLVSSTTFFDKENAARKNHTI
jgi:drug/metabolite transporter (DMT)-like permease